MLERTLDRSAATDLLVAADGETHSLADFNRELTEREEVRLRPSPFVGQ